ncbi:MLP-like protein 43 [Corylus avellana]|uniref:MLP-like protein 43 n=1 Tax=Corylus avellana TaxID=13451 RepID=UPI00286C5B29|nr:MLP-like protein 43 [Corylus avellana]
MASLKGKLETEIEIKADPQKFYEIFKKQAHQVPNATPDHIQAVEVHEGDWETHGSIKLWKYTVEGNAEVFKEKVEFDDASKTVTLVVSRFAAYFGESRLQPLSRPSELSEIDINFFAFPSMLQAHS